MWDVKGACMYQQTRFTAYVKSGLVVFKYHRAPTILLYEEAVVKGESGDLRRL